MLNFGRPEMSRILGGMPAEAEGRAEALAIIAQGARRLAERPRADMEGFVPCETDLQREVRYQARLAQEREVYRAIREGRKVYDVGLGR